MFEAVHSQNGFGMAGLRGLAGLAGTEGVHDTPDEVIRGTRILLRTVAQSDVYYQVIIPPSALSAIANAMRGRGYVVNSITGTNTDTVTLVATLRSDKPTLEQVIDDFVKSVNDGLRPQSAYRGDETHVEVQDIPDEASGGTQTGGNGGANAGSAAGAAAGAVVGQAVTIRASNGVTWTGIAGTVLRIITLGPAGESAYEVGTASAPALIKAAEAAGNAVKSITPDTGFLAQIQAQLRDFAIGLGVSAAIGGAVLLLGGGIALYAVTKALKR